MSDEVSNSSAESLRIRNFRQLDNVDIDLSKRITLIAGENGSGKTTILRLLSQFVGWVAEFPGTTDTSSVEVSARWVPGGTKKSHNGIFQIEQGRRGIYVPAHRTGYGNARLQNIPVRWNDERFLLDEYRLKEQQRLFPSSYGGTDEPNMALKAGLVSAALFGFATGHGVEPNIRAKKLFESFNELLKKLLPNRVGFKGLIVRSPDVFLDTENGEFSLDHVSGGTGALLDLSWQMTLATQTDSDSEFLVLIDELENHLHPAAQRTVLPTLAEAFPNAIFIVATHSPHIFASIEDATHVVLRRDEIGFVSDHVDMPASLLTPDEVLRNALGLDVTMPLWVEAKLAKIVEEHQGDLTESSNYDSLRDSLRDAGLGRLLPTATAKILGDAA